MSNHTVATAGGSQVTVEDLDGSTIAVCESGCGACRTFWAHLSQHPAAEARGWAQGHAGLCDTKPKAGAA